MMMMMIMMMMMMMMMRMITLRRMMERMIASMLRKMSRGLMMLTMMGSKGRFTETRPQTKSKLHLRRTLCASLRSRNAYGHLTRALSCGRLQAKKAHPKHTWTCVKSHSTREIDRQTAPDQELTKLARQALREPAQSKYI